MKRFFLVLTFLTLCLMLCANASADSAPMQLMRMNPLAFSKQPTRIESVTPTPDGSFAIIYFADSDTAGMQEMRLELVNSAGASPRRRLRRICCPPRWGKLICWMRVRRIRTDR